MLSTFRPSAFLVALMLSAVFAAAPLTAESLLNANDLAPGAITAPTPVDSFVLLAKADKAVNVETFDKARTADDGEVFNARIKLNGGGSTEFRAIRLTAGGKSRLTLYTNSSSKTDPRILKVVDEAGTVLAELAAPADDEVHAGMVGVDLPQAGTYYVFSASGGINLYLVSVK